MSEYGTETELTPFVEADKFVPQKYFDLMHQAVNEVAE